MKNKITLALSFLLCAGTMFAEPWFPEKPARPKIIELSWSNPTVDYYVKNLKTLEKYAPVDGLTIRVYGTPRMVNGKKFVPTSALMGKIAWKYEDFREAIAKLKAAKSKKFTENLFYTTVSPGDVDWFSDDFWKIVVNNYAIAARVAKESGMRGLLVDVEEYAKLFWKLQNYKGKRSYTELRKIARQRGREWGKAVFGAFPDGIYLFPHFIGFHNYSVDSLIEPFIDGLFDVVPPQALILDGQESPSYRARFAEEYDRLYILTHHRQAEYLSPENRQKYRANVRFTPAFYLDAYFPFNPKFSWHQDLKPEIDKGAVNLFGRNLMSAMNRAEGYIWFYSEQSSWWPNVPHHLVKTTWEERAPGITQIVNLARDPDKFPLEKLAVPFEKLSTENLLQTSRWSFWQRENDIKGAKRPGRGRNAGDIQQITGANHGCFLQKVHVRPGETYLFRADFCMEKELAGKGSLVVSYQDKQNKWLAARDVFAYKPAKPDEWIKGSLIFKVPKDAVTATIQLFANDQKKQSSVSFRNAEVIRNPEIKTAQDGKNLVVEKKWSFWQRETAATGSGRNAGGIQQFTGVTQACYSQVLYVKPGEIYSFQGEFRMEKELAGNASLTVSYQDSKYNWVPVRYTFACKPAKPGEWVKGRVIAVVPKDAKQGFFQLCVGGQGKQNTASFRNVSIMHDTSVLSKLNGRNLVQDSRWSLWQRGDETRKKGSSAPGTGSNVNGIQRMTNVIDGCFSQNIPVKAGEVYLLRADCRMEKEISGSGSLQICFIDFRKKWMEERSCIRVNPSKPDQWVTRSLIVTIPENAVKASIQLGACAQRNGAAVSFRNVVLIPLFK